MIYLSSRSASRPRADAKVGPGYASSGTSYKAGRASLRDRPLFHFPKKHDHGYNHDKQDRHSRSPTQPKPIMIAHLSGTVLYKDNKHAVIQTGGVGYKVYATERDLELMRVTEHVSVWVYTAVKEDALDLYGFILRDCKDMFDHLLTISGVGPKTALNILNVAGHEAIVSAVVSGELTYLTSISGIGKKMAEKIVLELKGKIAAIEHIDPVTGEKISLGQNGGSGDLAGATQSDIDTIEALKSLGYTHREAKAALEQLDKETRAKDIGEKIKLLLKMLG